MSYLHACMGEESEGHTTLPSMGGPIPNSSATGKIMLANQDGRIQKWLAPDRGATLEHLLTRRRCTGDPGCPKTKARKETIKSGCQSLHNTVIFTQIHVLVMMFIIAFHHNSHHGGHVEVALLRASSSNIPIRMQLLLLCIFSVSAS